MLNFEDIFISKKHQNKKKILNKKFKVFIQLNFKDFLSLLKCKNKLLIKNQIFIV